MDGVSHTGIAPVLKLALSQVMFELAIVLVLMFILVMAALYDYRERRIPNLLSVSGWLLGPLLHLAMAGVPGLKASLLGFLIIFVLTFPLWLLGWIGAGDVKLMVAVGALVGSGKSLFTLFCIVIAGLLYAIAYMLYQSALGSLHKKDRDKELVAPSVDQAALSVPEVRHERQKLPYAIPIAFGTLLGLLLLYR